MEVTEKQPFGQAYNDGVKAAAARTQAIASAEKARAEKAKAMSDIGAEIIVDLTVDLNNYTHIALVNVTYANTISGVKISNARTYEDFANLFSSKRSKPTELIAQKKSL